MVIVGHVDCLEDTIREDILKTLVSGSFVKSSENNLVCAEGLGSSFSESTFGVATVIDLGNNYIGVICKSKLLKLKLKVSDINHLTFDEWKDLFNEFRIEMGNLCLTSSDCDISTKGNR